MDGSLNTFFTLMYNSKASVCLWTPMPTAQHLDSNIDKIEGGVVSTTLAAHDFDRNSS